MLNASREFVKGDPKNFIPADAIMRIAGTFLAWTEEDNYSRVIGNDEIGHNDFNLSPSRYIRHSDEVEHRPIAEIMDELAALEQQYVETSRSLMELIEAIGG
jgi:type I restriction enzyme M protein